MEGKKREKSELNSFWYHCTIKDTVHATVASPAIVRGKNVNDHRGLTSLFSFKVNIWSTFTPTGQDILPEWLPQL